MIVDIRKTGLFAALLIMLISSICFAYPLGKPGTAYRYKLTGDMKARPEAAVTSGAIVVSAELALGPVVDKRYQWVSLSFTRENGRSYDAMLLMDKWPGKKGTPNVVRYLWHEPVWSDYLEYVNEVTGKAELPRFDLWTYSWPRSADNKSPAAFARAPKEIQLQGWPFKLEKIIKREVVVPTKITVIKLNPDLIIGLAGVSRDVAGRHKDNLGVDQYDFVVPQTEEDWHKEIDSGLNLFFQSSAEKEAPWLWRTSAYICQMYVMPDDWPANLYRSNYWGRSFHVDEPAIYNRSFDYNTQNAGKLTPVEASNRLEEMIMSSLNNLNNNYGNRILGLWVDRVFGKGSLDIVETKFPVWEAIWQTSWYELAPEGTVCGVVDEDYYPDSMVESYNAALETQIPASVENATALRVAVGRGAARNFDKNWGTAIYAYGQGALDPKIDLTGLKCAYEAGATYFWHWFGWPGMSDAVVPYSYRMAYASGIRQFFKENPNRDMDALLHAAKVCIVLPNGFTFSAGPLHSINWLHLERTTPEGSTYRQILRNAGLEAERCIRNGIKFDFAVDEPRFKPSGYDELVYCLSNGTVKTVRPGQADRIAPRAIEPDRPDLGPLPSVRIEVVDMPSHAPGTVKLKGIGTPGTGELALGTQKEKAVWWEVYTPENGFIGPFGEEVSFEAKIPGTYKIRATVVDVFGRPSYTETSIEIKGDPNEISVFPDKWLFQKDPDNSGESKGYAKVDFADSSWPAIPVPAGWEHAPEVGEYDGYGWYRVKFNVPTSAAGQKLALAFEGVDEQAWVWLNGQSIGERSVASTGKSADDIWDKPFALDIPAGLIKAGAENTLVVKVHDYANMGGIYAKIKLLLTK